MVAKIRPSAGKPVLFFDGLKSHTSKKSMPTVLRYFRPLKNVPYSCAFNTIEAVWSVTKNNFVKLTMQLNHWYDDEEFYSLVRRSCTMIPRATIKNLMRSNHAYIRSVLSSIDE